MDNIEEGILYTYTDGSSYSRPRKGGVGYRFVFINSAGDEEQISSSHQGYTGATNNEMELQACILALEDCLSKRPSVDVMQFRGVEIYTDSMYIKEHYQKAIFVWPRNGWRLSSGAPVQNAELWKKLSKLIQKLYRDRRRRVSINWIKAHKASKHNKAVDRLAKFSAKNASKKTLSISDVRRKVSKKSTERGSVMPTGQRITIRIIEDKYLKTPRCYWYRYEVMSTSSVFYGNVDIISSDISLNAGHVYSVRLNDDAKNPCIVKVFKEVTK